MIVREITSLEELIKHSKNPFPDRIKFFIHKTSKTLAIDEPYHVDMENELIDEIGTNLDIFGGDILLDPVHVLWESDPNIALNLELGVPVFGRTLKNRKLIDELF